MIDKLRPFEVPGRVSFDLGRGALPRAHIESPWARAELYLHGAQVTEFEKRGEAPLLFLSDRAQFVPGKAIRGGVPICFPWFGSRPGKVSHGFARLTDWKLSDATASARGETTVRLRLPELEAAAEWPRFTADFTVTVSDRLELELAVTNHDSSRSFEFEDCLHTYFRVGDVEQIEITGLESTRYLDKLEQNAARTQPAEPVRIRAQVDRTFLDTTNAVQIHDPVLQRIIRIDKEGSASTVVWNPWTTQVLSDLGPEEYRRMVCVESGNVETNRLELLPSQTARLKVVLSTAPFS